MAKKKIEKDPEVQIEEAISKSEKFIEKNAKTLLGIVIVIALAVGGFYGYDHFYASPRAEEASTNMFEAQVQFEQDSFAVALNGVEGVFSGFADILQDFSGTPQANLAAHYAGICAMNLGDFEGAIKYLTQYSNTKTTAGEIIDAQNYGLQGDCNMELGKSAEAIALYKKAISSSNSDATAPVYTQKLVIALYEAGNYAEAVAQLKSLKEKHPASTQARDADKYITLMQQK